jgi:UDP-N-acetylmuramoyl-tripeptide--D-alanyl-D-alanine ligase
MRIPLIRSLGRAGIDCVAMLYRRLALRHTTVVVVTGSCGKSTTKDLTAGVLRTRLRGFASPLNNNMPWHITRLVLKNRPSHEFCVIELGAAGETLLPIEKPLRILQPSIGVVTNIGTDHFTVFRSLDATAEHKGQLIEALRPDGIAVLNADDPRVLGMRSRCRGRVVTYGFGAGADVTGANVTSAWPDRLALDVTAGGRTVHVQTRLCGTHLAPNVLAAIAVGHMMGIPLETAAEGIASVEPFEGRMSPVTTADGITFICDDQKSPMWTIPAALEFLRTARAPRKIVVQGTISDFPGNPGRKIPRVAAAILDYADILLGVGGHATYTLRARARVDGRLRHAVSTAEDALAWLQQHARRGDLILLKGSRSDRLALIAERWKPIVRNAAHDAPARAVAPHELNSRSAQGAWLIVGLGNPEARYDGTPHNIGYAVVDQLAERLGARWTSRHTMSTATAEVAGEPVVLTKTGTYVNHTGPALHTLATELGVSADRCVVVLDDLHIAPGAVRRRDNGSSGGHNGMQSLIVAFQTEHIRRVKVGVGRPADGDVARFVLQPFDASRRALMSKAAAEAADTVLQMLRAPRPNSTAESRDRNRPQPVEMPE